MWIIGFGGYNHLLFGLPIDLPPDPLIDLLFGLLRDLLRDLLSDLPLDLLPDLPRDLQRDLLPDPFPDLLIYLWITHSIYSQTKMEPYTARIRFHLFISNSD